MAKPKASTLQQRFGFKDTDLTTPKHDEIMLWLDENIKIIIEESSFHKELIHREWNKEPHLKETENIINNRPIPPENLYEVWDIVKVWEYPITDKQRYSSGNKTYIIGFVDFRVKYRRNYLGLCGSGDRYSEKWKWNLNSTEEYINFEVKTQIPSLGELFRQIHVYQTYNSDPFVIVSPEDKFKEQIESQKYIFLRYEPNRFQEIVF